MTARVKLKKTDMSCPGVGLLYKPMKGDFKIIKVKGDKSKLVIHDGCRLGLKADSAVVKQYATNIHADQRHCTMLL